MVLWLAAAYAQAPMVLGADDDAELVWIASTTEAAKSKRFFDDAEQNGPVFGPAASVRVLIRENGMVRVRSGEDYGWLPASAVVSENPKPATTLQMPSFDIPGAGG